MSVKVCSKCREEKSLTEFHRYRDGHQSRCKSCCKLSAKEHRKSYIKTARGLAVRAWSHIVDRAGNRDGKNPTYTSVKLLMTRVEFLAWAIPAFNTWLLSNPECVGSVDRKKDSDHYAVSNLQIISLSDNVRKKSCNKNVHAPADMAWCRVCECYKSVSDFYVDKSRYHGLHYLCKSCMKHKRKRRTKKCLS